MQLETEEPIHTGFTAPGASLKDPVRVNAPIVADLEACGINERDAATAPFPALQVAAQRHESRGHQFHEAVVTHQAREVPSHVLEDVLRVISLEVAIT